MGLIYEGHPSEGSGPTSPEGWIHEQRLQTSFLGLIPSLFPAKGKSLFPSGNGKTRLAEQDLNDRLNSVQSLMGGGGAEQENCCVSSLDASPEQTPERQSGKCPQRTAHPSARSVSVIPHSILKA